MGVNTATSCGPRPEAPCCIAQMLTLNWLAEWLPLSSFSHWVAVLEPVPVARKSPAVRLYALPACSLTISQTSSWNAASLVAELEVLSMAVWWFVKSRPRSAALVAPKSDAASVRFAVPEAGNEKLWKISTHQDWKLLWRPGSVVRS